jgi:dihydrodipicolinate synthase/N-acetylneuraminate lyase
MRKAQFFTPVVTCFDKSGQLDRQANEAVYEHVITGGIDGLVVMGSTGEFFAMTMEQKKELINIVMNYVRHRTKVYIGTGGMSAGDTIELSNYAHQAGADGVMIISPYYFRLTPASIEAFYDAVAPHIKAEIFLYNYPDCTGYDLTPDIILNLLRRHKNIVGFKDTVSRLGHTRDLIVKILPEFPDFAVYSGFDDNLAFIMSSGGAGCIGGLSNLVPKKFSAWVKAIDEKDSKASETCQQFVNQLMEFYSIGQPFIAMMKKAMKLRGIALEDYCTIPLLQANERQVETIKALMKKLDIK